MSWMNKDEVKISLKEYSQKCKILKQINSDKAFACRRRHATITIFTIAFSVVLTSFGFIEKDRVVNIGWPELSMAGEYRAKTLQQQTIIQDKRTYIKDSLNITTDALVLIVLTLTVISLIYRWQDRAVEHNRAVAILAVLDNDIDDLVNLTHYSDEELSHSYELIRIKYQMIADFLPPNSDKEFVEAKKSYEAKHPQRSLEK